MELSQAIHLIAHPSLAQQNNALWADLGCGSGLFTYALANLLPDGSRIYAIDKREVEFSKQTKPSNTVIERRQADFVTQALNLPHLDGILMANSLHYVPDKTAFIQQIRPCLKDHGGFLVVEYDTDTSNRWVPYPIRYAALKLLFETAGFPSVTWLGERSSVYGSANMYAAYIGR
jgi:ubiquinone/menaquinone biosynthesis C-methylase UbiE